MPAAFTGAASIEALQTDKDTFRTVLTFYQRRAHNLHQWRAHLPVKAKGTFLSEHWSALGGVKHIDRAHLWTCWDDEGGFSETETLSMCEQPIFVFK